MLGTVEVAGDDISRQVLSWLLLTSLFFEALKLTLQRNFKKLFVSILCSSFLQQICCGK